MNSLAVSTKTSLLRFARLLCALSLTAPFLTSAQNVDPTNPLGFELLRSHAPTYAPGQPVEVRVTLAASTTGEGLTAVGLRETIPSGWVFTDMRPFNGQPPAVSPQPGTTDLLEFAWISPPQLPTSFVYTVTPPPDAIGDQVIHGQFEYRTSGNRLFGPPVITSFGGPPDTVPPEITLQGPNPVELQVGQPYQEPGYVAEDNVDGDLTDNVTVEGSVNTQAAGNYTLTYRVADAAGNQARPVTRRIVVSEPPPVDDTDAGSDPGTQVANNNRGSTVSGTRNANAGRRQPGVVSTGVGGGGRTGNADRPERNTRANPGNNAAANAAENLKSALAGNRPNTNIPNQLRPADIAQPAISARNAPGVPANPAAKLASRVAQNIVDPGLTNAAESGKANEGSATERAQVAAAAGSDDGGPKPPGPRRADPPIIEARLDLADAGTAALAATATSAKAKTANRDKPSVLALIREGFARMGPADYALLVIALGVVGLLGGLTYFAWRLAYAQPVRRPTRHAE